jgi:TonB-linked SusC/RagA family outer membrane protein
MQLLSYCKAPSWGKLNRTKILLVMKLTTFFLLFACLQVTAKGVAQKITLNETNSNLESILKKIEAQSEYTFLYKNNVLRKAAPVTLHVTQMSIDQVLELCFSGQPLTYKIFDQTVVIKEKVIQAILKSATVTNAPPPILIKGKVVTEKDEPIQGVSVMLKGSTTGSVTDASGLYSIAAADDGILVFSYVGYITQEIPVNNQTAIDVKLVEESKALNAVVVTALGIKRETKSLTYSTQSVDTKSITEARELNLMNSLEGKVAGLSINTSGSGLGADARVVLRGDRSISGDSQPLYVVDGVPIMGTPTDLSLDNLASINVLKGPNAAALYGSAAQNGVIILTTKKGKSGIHVSLNNSFMIQDPVVLVKFQNQFGQGQAGLYDKNSEFSWGPKMEGQMVDNWTLDPSLTGSQYALNPQPNNIKDALQQGSNLASNLTMSLGGEKTQALFSYTYTKGEGTLPGNTLDRHNVSLRVTSELSERFSFDSKVDYMQQKIENGFFGGRYNPTQMIYQLPRSIRTQDLADFEYTNTDNLVKQNYFNPGSANGGNPYWIFQRAPNETTRRRVISMASLTYKFSKALSVMARASFDGSNGGTENKFYNDNYASAPDGMYTLSRLTNSEFNGDFLLTYSKDVNKDWNFNLNAGGNVKYQRNNALSSSTGTAMIVPNFFTLSNTNLPVTSYNPGPNQDIQSLYAFGRVSYRNAVFLDVTGRNDWSSTLPSNNRSYFYPSLGLSAVLTDLIHSLPSQISFAKIRGSWAEVGNGATPYMLQRTAIFTSGGDNGFLQLNSTLPNPNLKPEKTKSLEGGLDLRFLNNRLGISFTTYKTNTINQLFLVALPVGSGASQSYTNGGDVENKGVEIVLNATPVRTTNFQWEVTANFARNKNKVKELSNGLTKLNLTPTGFFSNFILEQGQPFGNIYSRGFLRDSLGRVIVGTDGLPEITNGQTVLVGNFNPDWTGSLVNYFSYKNFSLSFVIEHREGGTVASETNAILYADGVTEQTLPGRDGSLVFGENVFSKETAVMADGSKNVTKTTAENFWRSIGGRNTPVGEAFVDNATNTRLRELTLGYMFPKKMLGGLPFSGVKLSFVARNLFFIYRASANLDPDFMNGTTPTSEGTQAFTPTTTRSMGLNLKIDF